MKKFLSVVSALLSATIILSSVVTAAPAGELSGHWASEHIRRLLNAGLLSSNDSIRPDDYLTRAEAAAFLGAMIPVDFSLEDSYDDIDESTPGFAAMLKMGAANILYVAGESMQPGGYISREEAIHMLYTAFYWQPAESFLAAVSDWDSVYYKDEVASFAYYGCIPAQMTADGAFYPQNAITRAEFFAIFSRMMGRFSWCEEEKTGYCDTVLAARYDASMCAAGVRLYVASDTGESTESVVYLHRTSWPESNYKYLLSTYTTAFPLSSVARANNIKIAADGYINNTVLQPGEVFSFNSVVGERTAEKGYGMAGVYTDGGTTVNGIGGGICQASSTVFNAALLAGMDILERHSHVKSVTYVEAGRDATVYLDQLDLKFRNSLEIPVQILTSTDLEQGTVTVSFYAPKPYELPEIVVSAYYNKGYRLYRYVDGALDYQTVSFYNDL